MFNCAMMTQSIFLICVLVCNSVALSSSWQTIVIKRSPTNYKKLIRNFGTRQSEDYILRVCSGPACSNFNPSFTYSRLQSELTEIPDLKIKTIDCLSACKRGCNVALIRKGECAGEFIEGMNSVEKLKGCFYKVNSEESILRVSACIKKHFEER